MSPNRLLLPLSWLYGAGVRLRNLAFTIGILPQTDVGVPVISVGNITAGGNGKTPMTAEIVSLLRAKGKRPAVVSRGYGRMTAGTVVACDGSKIVATAAEAGDEPLLIARLTNNAIVIADEDRVRGARHAINEFGADVIVLDDGFQHRYIQRTLDIVLVDAGQPPFNTALLPAGYRREPLSSMRRASAVVVTKCSVADEADAIRTGIAAEYEGPFFSAGYSVSGLRHVFGGVRQSTDILKGQTAVAVSGIASPDGFRRVLEGCGVTIKRFFAFPDHHRYEEREADLIVKAFKTTKADFLLTTEKDAVRLETFEEKLVMLPVSALTMQVTIHQRSAWEQYILKGIA